MKNLTKQEKEVLKLLVQGLSNKEISENMNLSIHTIKSYLESIYEKLNVSNRVQAAVVVVLVNIILL